MFLAGKVEETPIPLKDVILISYEFIHKKDPAAGQRIKQQKVMDYIIFYFVSEVLTLSSLSCIIVIYFWTNIVSYTWELLLITLLWNSYEYKFVTIIAPYTPLM